MPDDNMAIQTNIDNLHKRCPIATDERASNMDETQE